MFEWVDWKRVGQGVENVPMSPLSRGRKNRRSAKGRRRAVPLSVVGSTDPCDCPDCSGADFDPVAAVDSMLHATSALATAEDPLDAELGAASLLSVGAFAAEDFDEMLVGGLIPQFEARATTEALAMLMALGSVGRGETADAARTAAGRLVASGVARPKWAAEFADPTTAGDFCRLYDVEGTASMLVCSFHRSGRGHAMVVAVDHADCGAASDIMLAAAADLPIVLETIRASGRETGLDIRTEQLEPAELRWQLENALDARAVHDLEVGGDAIADEPPGKEDDGPGYPVLAALLRARLDILPASDKPPVPHSGVGDVPSLADLLSLRQFVGAAAAGVPRGRKRAGLPPKRTKSAGPAPIYQLKVGLRGAKPPIWRRLEVPADLSLARLHGVVQIAFGWQDGHMHVFETPFGDFGAADAELGYRAERPVSLEQVAPAVNSRIRYVYDFGDDWQHDILVEKVVDRDPTARYPRCTGGRRAAPPDDCGGIWGYADLVEVLGDPEHPDHQERLEWLGLDDGDAFKPDRFDQDAVNRGLSSMG